MRTSLFLLKQNKSKLLLGERRASPSLVNFLSAGSFGTALLGVGEPNFVFGLGLFGLLNSQHVLLPGHRLLQLLLHHDVVVPGTGTREQLPAPHG